MSRHVLRSDDRYTVVVGYDDPLDTFFAQVYDVVAEHADPDGYDHLLVDTGGLPRDVTDPVVCIESVAEYIDVTADGIRDVVRALNAEQAHRREPTAFQRDNWRRFFPGEELP